MRAASNPRPAYAVSSLCSSLLKRTEDEIDTPVELPYSQSELASIVGVSRQTINQLMHALAAQGLIQTGFKHVRVLAPQELLAGL